jgi:hypothetical protein
MKLLDLTWLLLRRLVVSKANPSMLSIIKRWGSYLTTSLQNYLRAEAKI